jgi:hypothetical protein
MLYNLRYFLYQVRVNKINGSSLSQIKYFLAWNKSLSSKSNSIKDEQPWITFTAIDFLKKHISEESKIFEYGGGGSTLFFLKRTDKVITIEHDKEWFTTLQKIIKEKKYTNWDGCFILPEKGDLLQNPNSSNPNHYSSNDEASVGYNYKKYASGIDVYGDNYFDFILIDGRSRPSCIMHSIKKIKDGGYLILDNSDRTYYLENFSEIFKAKFESVIDHFGACPYSKQFTKTSIWRKK